MTAWTSEQLERIAGADELQISSRRPDGSLRPGITIWVVREGDDLYVRSAYGPGNGWFRRALGSGTGRIVAGGVEQDVAFEQVPPADPVQESIDAAYHAKYDRYGARIVNTVVGTAAQTTIRLLAAP